MSRSPTERVSPRPRSSPSCHTLGGRRGTSVPRSSTGGLDDGGSVSTSGLAETTVIASDAMLEGFYRGVTLCEKVVRNSLPESEHASLMVELAAISQEAYERRSAGVLGLSPLWSSAAKARSPALGSGTPRHLPHSGSGEEPAFLSEVAHLQMKVHERDLLLAATRGSVAVAGRETSELRAQLLDRDKRLAAFAAREDKRGRQILHLQAELARAYQIQVSGLCGDCGAAAAGAEGNGRAAPLGAASVDAAPPSAPPKAHAREDKPLRVGVDKGSFIHAAGGKVYWLNHEDPLDLQRLPDAVPGGSGSSAGAAGMGPPERSWQYGDAAVDEPLLPVTPEPQTRATEAEVVPSPHYLQWYGSTACSGRHRSNSSGGASMTARGGRSLEDAYPLASQMLLPPPPASSIKRSRSGPQGPGTTASFSEPEIGAPYATSAGPLSGQSWARPSQSRGPPRRA